MKHNFLIFSMILSLSSWFVCADDAARVDVNGVKDSIPMRQIETGNTRISFAGWLKEQGKANQCLVAHKAVKNDVWEPLVFGFIPEKDGTVEIQLGGQSGKTPIDHGYVVFDDIRITAILIPGETDETAEGGSNLQKWWNNRFDEVRGVEPQKGRNAIIVNYDHRTVLPFPVRKGLTYIFKGRVRKAPTH